MATRGRKPIPGDLKLIRGERNKDRINLDEPKPKVRIPECPDFLDEGARREWDRVAPYLYGMGLISDLDAMVFAGYCQLVSRWERIEKTLAESPLVDEKHTVDGAGVEHTELKQSPLVVMARRM
ncbi:MAG: hypothetical protein GTO24_07515 [candidate division Zixibacteria bacterium]|nr:hypothetical protein [candidate division Zixibacteria bacterium]